MNESAQKTFHDERALELLRDLGVLTPEIVAELRYELNKSLTGRVFGHPAAIEFPEHLERLAEMCSTMVHANDDETLRVRSIFTKAFNERRPRRVTFLNILLKSIADEVVGYQASGVPANDDGDRRRFSLVRRIRRLFSGR